MYAGGESEGIAPCRSSARELVASPLGGADSGGSAGTAPLILMRHHQFFESAPYVDDGNASFPSRSSLSHEGGRCVVQIEQAPHPNIQGRQPQQRGGGTGYGTGRDGDAVSGLQPQQHHALS